MQCFINDNFAYAMLLNFLHFAYAFEFPDKFKDEFKDDLNPVCITEMRLAGSVSETLIDFSGGTVYTLLTRCKYSTII